MKQRTGKIVFILFSLGMAAGILAAFFLRDYFLEQYDSMQKELLQALEEKLYARTGLFMFLFWQRCKQVLFFFGILLTSAGLPFLYFMAGFLGMAGGCYLFAACCRYGISGTLVFFSSFFPQMLCYLPLCYLLVTWGIGKRVSGSRLLLGSILLILGCFTETCFHPPFLRWVLNLTV
jgi:hypothetical protein